MSTGLTKRFDKKTDTTDAIANKINKLVKKGSKGRPQAGDGRGRAGHCNPRDEQQDTGDREGEEEDEAR